MLEAGEQLQNGLREAQREHDRQQGWEARRDIQEQLDEFILEQWLPLVETTSLHHPPAIEERHDHTDFMPFAGDGGQNYYSQWATIEARSTEAEEDDDTILQARLVVSYTEESDQSELRRIKVYLRMGDTNRTGCYSPAEKAMEVICPRLDEENKKIQGAIIAYHYGTGTSGSFHIHPDGEENWQQMQASLEQLKAADFAEAVSTPS